MARTKQCTRKSTGRKTPRIPQAVPVPVVEEPYAPNTEDEDPPDDSKVDMAIPIESSIDENKIAVAAEESACEEPSDASVFTEETFDSTLDTPDILHVAQDVVAQWLARVGGRNNKTAPTHTFLAHPLQDSYSANGPTFQNLSRIDKNTVATIKSMAATHGGSIYLARVIIQVSGDGAVWKDGDGELPSSDMVKERQRKYTFEAAVGPDGLEVHVGHLTVGVDGFSPPFDLSNSTPDDVEIEFQGMGKPEMISHYYQRAAVVLKKDPRAKMGPFAGQKRKTTEVVDNTASKNRNDHQAKTTLAVKSQKRKAAESIDLEAAFKKPRVDRAVVE